MNSSFLCVRLVFVSESKSTSKYGPFGPFVKCINNLESKYLGDKHARRSSLEHSDRVKKDSSQALSSLPPPLAPKPRKKEVELSDHIQFLITEKSPPQTCSVDVTRESVDESELTTEGE